ncbi:PIN domain-containing protein [Acrocarpospora catenulata]|uniref:PIN domain-containing protein n=1 Tax=Acrocarpospora catenulata TaxID=2836182 RepID=UPI001BD9D97B|nr:PIN domain-containing protein [Acrocarpospora catenulata]
MTLELDERESDLRTAIDELEQQAAHWGDGDALIVTDTGVFLNGPELPDLDLAPDIDAAEGERIRLIVPMIVIDELDKLKLHNNKDVRSRARRALRDISRLVVDIDRPNLLRDAEPPSVTPARGLRRGRVRIEIMFDPRGHIRLPINDDEIVDRALTVQSLAGREVWLAAYDTNQCLRARGAGLLPLQLTHNSADGGQ